MSDPIEQQENAEREIIDHPEPYEENHNQSQAVETNPHEEVEPSRMEEQPHEEPPEEIQNEEVQHSEECSKPPECNLESQEPMANKHSKEKASSNPKSTKQKQQESLERHKKLLEEQNCDNKQADEAQKQSKKILSIECCVLCSEHQYCTHHKEEKYISYFKQLKVEIERLNPEFHVCKNYRTLKPQLGALECKYNGVAVYSKLTEMKWPNAVAVAQKLKAIVEKERDDLRRAEEEEVERLERKRREEERREEERVADERRVDEAVVEEVVDQVHEERDVVDKENHDPDAFVNENKFTEEGREQTEMTNADNVLGERDLNQETVN